MCQLWQKALRRASEEHGEYNESGSLVQTDRAYHAHPYDILVRGLFSYQT